MAGLRILLIDDEADFLEVMGKRIETWGYESINAGGGREGLAALKNKKPDIIILDYLMPEMDGVATLKEIRRIDKKVPVIMFTAHADMKSIAGTERLGVASYIPKLSAYTDVQKALKAAIEMAQKKVTRSQ